MPLTLLVIDIYNLHKRLSYYIINKFDHRIAFLVYLFTLADNEQLFEVIFLLIQ